MENHNIPQTQQNEPLQAQPLTADDLKTLLQDFQHGRNGFSTQKAPKNVWELIYACAMTLGVPTVIIGVILLIAYQTFPPYIKANIQTQESLTKNLDTQTENIETQTKSLEAQTENLEAQTEAIQEVQQAVVQIVETEREAQRALITIENDHDQIIKDHASQAEEHKGMIEVLENISDKLQPAENP